MDATYGDLYYLIQAMNIRFCIRSQVGVQIPSCRMPTLATEWAWLGHIQYMISWKLPSRFSYWLRTRQCLFTGLDYWLDYWTHPKWCKVPFSQPFSV